MTAKIKKILSVALVLLMVFTSAPLQGLVGLELPGLFSTKASALETSGKCGENVTYTYNSSTGEVVISGTGAMYDYEAYDPISPFRYSDIKSVVIENGVTTIGDEAFLGCGSLTSITIPESVTSIGYGVFSSCESLTSVTIPDSVTSIGDYTFSDCISLTSVTIPDSVTSIGYFAFRDCDSLTSVTIPDSIMSIVSYTFDSCDNLKSVIIPDSVKSIGDGAFDFCKSLTSVTIPDSVTSIGNIAFWHCESLISVTIGNSVETIGDEAFSYCNSLINITIPDSVTSIGGDAFYFCGSLTDITVDINNKNYSSDECGVLFNKDKSVLIQYPIGNSRTSYKIPDSVTNIGDNAFAYCYSLTNLTIPDSVTSIGSYTFDSCDNLTDITVDINNKNYSSDECGVLFNKDKSVLIQYPIGNSRTSYKIPDSVTSIGDYAFACCDSLTSVIIPDSVEIVGYGAFDSCDSLTIVTIFDSVKSIGPSAFWSCDSLKDVYYTGISSQWKNIDIGYNNECLTNATIHYNYSPSSLVLGKTSKITATQTTSAVTLKWNAVPNATGYKIYQKTSKGWQSLGNVTGTSKTVSGLTAGTKYTFAVKAGAVVGGKTIWSDVYTTINTATKAIKPAKVTSTQNENSIKLTWTKCAGATGYRIYYRTSTKAAWKVGKSSTTATSHTFSKLKPNQAFQFAVRPYTIVDGVVIWSDYTTIIASTTPAVPVAKVSSPSKGKVTLTWNAVSGATGYQVYYKSGNGSWKLYKTTSKPTTYNFTKLKSGTKYTFAVRAYRTVSGTNFTSGYKAVSVTVK